MSSFLDLCLVGKNRPSSMVLQINQDIIKFGGQDCAILYKCDDCEKDFLTVEQLWDHGRCKPWVCSICYMSYSMKSKLDTHSITHTEERPYSCDNCDKSFKRKSELKSHLVLHSEVKMFKCSFCNAEFKLSGGLRSHMVTHTNLRLYDCSICKQTYKTRQGLKTHKLTHTVRNKTFDCTDCDASFVTKYYLDTHKATHSLDRPFPCPECGTCFGHPNNLRTHIDRSHTSYKPNKCNYCPKTFSKKFILNKHIKTHDKKPKPRETKAFPCLSCKLSFNKKVFLVRHRIKKHPAPK